MAAPFAAAPSGPRGLNRVSDNLQSSQVKDLIEHLSDNPDEIGNMLMLAKTGSLKPRTRPKKEDRRLLPIPMGNTRLSLVSREFIGECLGAIEFKCQQVGGFESARVRQGLQPQAFLLGCERGREAWGLLS